MLCWELCEDFFTYGSARATTATLGKESSLAIQTCDNCYECYPPPPPLPQWGLLQYVTNFKSACCCFFESKLGRNFPYSCVCVPLLSPCSRILGETVYKLEINHNSIGFKRPSCLDVQNATQYICKYAL